MEALVLVLHARAFKILREAKSVVGLVGIRICHLNVDVGFDIPGELVLSHNIQTAR